MRSFLFFISCVQLSLQLWAQSPGATAGNVEVYKEYVKTLSQVAPRVDLIFPEQRINVYVASVINAEGAYRSLVENRQWYAQAGIDIGFAEKWYLGLSTRANGGASNFNIYNVTTKLYVQHRGNIGKLVCMAEALYEHFNFSNNTEVTISSGSVVYSRRPAEGRAGLGLGVGRYFALGTNYIAAFLLYRPYLQFDFKDNNTSIYKNRFIDYTTFRIDLGYLVDHVWYIGFYATRDTNYMYVPASTAYNYNRITPIVGIACNLLLFPKSTKEKQLSSFRYFYTQ